MIASINTEASPPTQESSMSANLELLARMDSQRSRDLDLTDAADRANDLELSRASLADAADTAEARTRAAEDADYRTRAARGAIKGLGRSLTELEACALISALSNAISNSEWGHLPRATAAEDSLTDAHWALENWGEE
jgi:hypothetical protein